MDTNTDDAHDSAVFTLHRYFIWTNRMRNHLDDVLEEQGPMPDTNPGMSEAEREATEMAARAWFMPIFLYESYWLASLYVLVEGWKKLQLWDPQVNRYLDGKLVDRLRRHRNGIFHFEPTYLDDGVKLMVWDRSGAWILQARAFHDALSKYFLEWLRARGHDIPEDLGGSDASQS